MSNTAHTPLPWIARRKHPTAINAGISILGPEDSLGCRKVIAEIDSLDSAEENAHYLVRCVNLHEKLATALRTVVSMEYDRDEESRNFDSERLGYFASLIAEAEGRPA
jgi:hypothetical protein